jgi:tetraprenyl-beta-curcumene synthase
VCGRAPSARLTSRRTSASRSERPDAAPLSRRQLQALATAVTREITWGLPAVSREIANWRRVAARIRSGPLREDALDALERKRGQSDGAALFSILPRKRNRSYLRLLVAYQTIWDYLDSVSERGAFAGLANGRQLHLALVDALDPGGPIRDYYRYSPWREDGYLVTLVATCRACCARLPSFERVRELVLRDAERAQVLALNHEPDPAERDSALESWVQHEFPGDRETSWYELTGAASAGLAAFALLALACEPFCSDSEIARTHAAYFPWASAVACMLDSYADRHEDTANGDHSYIAHYPTPELAISGTCSLVQRCLAELHALENSEAHVLIVCSMIALYLSKDPTRVDETLGGSSRIAHAGGSLTGALLPILRLWHAAHRVGTALDDNPKETTVSPTARSSRLKRTQHELPPSPPHPAIVQTLAGRWSPYTYVEECQAVCGDRFTLYPLNMPPHVFFAGQADIQTILTGDATALHPGAAGSIVAPVAGERSFMLHEEDAHLWGRRAVTPAFHRLMVEKQTAVVADLVRRSVASWPLQTPVALNPYIRSLTLTVILQIIFSDQDTELKALHAALMPMLAITSSLSLQAPGLRHIPGWRSAWKRFISRRAEVDDILYRLVAERRAASRGDRPHDLLDMLLAAENVDGSPMSAAQVRDNLVSVILAGYETTTGQVGWAFQLLAHNPTVQARLIEELDCAAGEEYLTATAYETMRRKPVFLFAIPREVAEPVQIADVTYRPPVRLAACTYLLHHNADLYPNPHAFLPERFLGANAQSRAWLPWGGGRKHCLGRHLAMLELTTILREVLSTMAVVPAADRIERPRWRGAILVPSAGGRVVLRDRRHGAPFFFRSDS